MTIRDEEGDILAGRHLSADEELHVGKRLLIDIFNIEVLECVQVPLEGEEQAVVVDITEDVDGPKSTQRFGGCFWILADEDEDDDDLPETSGVQLRLDPVEPCECVCDLALVLRCILSGQMFHCTGRVEAWC